MSTYKATVIKAGNSYALRMPKKYIEDAQLVLGQKLAISSPEFRPGESLAYIRVEHVTQKLNKAYSQTDASLDLGLQRLQSRSLRKL